MLKLTTIKGLDMTYKINNFIPVSIRIIIGLK